MGEKVVGLTQWYTWYRHAVFNPVGDLHGKFHHDPNVIRSCMDCKFLGTTLQRVRGEQVGFLAISSAPGVSQTRRYLFKQP